MAHTKQKEIAQSYGERLVPGDRYVDEREASELDGMSVFWHQRRRWDGSGPPYRRIGRSVRYRLSELIRWFEERRVQSTSEHVKASALQETCVAGEAHIESDSRQRGSSSRAKKGGY
jgi:predicted DNA-binding transcriptional regulator AlpA